MLSLQGTAVLTPVSALSCHLIRSGQAAPECAAVKCALFHAEDNQGPSDSGRAFHLSLNCLKQFL